MSPRAKTSSALRSLYRKPSPLTFGAAAATLAAAAIAVGAIASGPSGAPVAANVAALGNFASFDPTISPHGPVGSSASGTPAAHSPAHIQLDTRRGTADRTASQHGASAQAPAKSAQSAQPAHSAAPAKPAHSAAPAKHAQPAKPATPYLMYDSVIPSAIPRGKAAATYASGPYAVQPSQVAGLGHVIWIDTNGSNPAASALDVEPGDAAPSEVAGWVRSRLTAHPHALARIYTTLSEWSAAQASVATLPNSMRAQVRWWIADPTGVPHMVPGADATQYYWGSQYDISLVKPGF